VRFNNSSVCIGLRMAAGCAALAAAGMVCAQDLDAGKAQFVTSCGVCHAVDPAAPPRQGPPLGGIFGRKAGQHPGFRYSAPLKAADWVWNEATLDPWVENAQAAHPGTTMNYRQADPDKRARIIAYLKSISQP
jgi:cytochrome c